MQIRKAEVKDLTALVALDRLYSRERRKHVPAEYRRFEVPQPVQELRRRLRARHSRTFVAVDRGVVVGYLVARLVTVDTPGPGVAREGRVCDVFVAPSHRRRGVASRLYAAVGAWFDVAGCSQEGLTVQLGNPARAVYERWGFAGYSLHMRKRRAARTRAPKRRA